MPNVLSTRDLVSGPDNTDKTVLHPSVPIKKRYAKLSLNLKVDWSSLW